MDRLEASRYAGRINRSAIEYGFQVAQPGTTLLEIDKEIEEYLLVNDCQPIFKGYRGYPSTCCLSPNNVVVHGVPNNYILKDGDILTIDVGCQHEGWMVDSAETRIIGIGNFPFQEHLVSATKSVLYSQMSVIKDGVNLLEIALAAQNKAKELGVNIFPQWGGHSIGQTLHEEPFIPNCLDLSLPSIQLWQQRKEYEQYKLKAGKIICLEPVATFGKFDTITDSDGWTIRTKDSSLVAHFEHCILITEKGYEIIS